MTVFSFLCVLFVVGSFFLEVDAFAPSSRPRMMSSRSFLLKKVHEHENFITSLRNLNQDDDADDKYLFAQKGKITREGEGDYFESEFDRTPVKDRLPVALGFLGVVSLPFIVGLIYLYSNK